MNLETHVAEPLILGHLNVLLISLLRLVLYFWKQTIIRIAAVSR